MDRLTCDGCGAPLLVESDVRYEVKIEVKAAYDPMEITEDDLKKDYRAEMAKLIAKLEHVTEAQAMDEVYRTFRFDLCTPCQRKYLVKPLVIPR
jgi:hypothetical protein